MILLSFWDTFFFCRQQKRDVVFLHEERDISSGLAGPEVVSLELAVVWGLRFFVHGLVGLAIPSVLVSEPWVLGLVSSPRTSALGRAWVVKMIGFCVCHFCSLIATPWLSDSSSRMVLRCSSVVVDVL